VRANDTAGILVLQRETIPAAQKKAEELKFEGCWDVEIIEPDGTIISVEKEPADSRE